MEIVAVEIWQQLIYLHQAGIYLFKVKNWNTRTICEIGSELKVKASERLRWRAFVDNFDFTHCSGVSMVDFKQVNAGLAALLQIDNTTGIILDVSLKSLFEVTIGLCFWNCESFMFCNIFPKWSNLSLDTSILKLDSGNDIAFLKKKM